MIATHSSKCYVPDETYVWLPAQILREIPSQDPKKPEKTLVLRVYPPSGDCDAAGAPEERVLDFNDRKVQALLKTMQLESLLPYQNEHLGPQGIEDMTALNYLHEAAILYNVKTRFLQQLPYTYTGDICIAVNPYQWLPELYSEATQLQYLMKPREELPPHVYATSMASYKDMKVHAVNQSILVSGESGAGKTETTKVLMNHLASIAGGLNDYTIKKIIEVNPLLESFGNAKTVRNDNSSRFGKFTQLQFDNDGTLVGARCRTYLLEKTRVISHEKAERNYHIFYQLLSASDSKARWCLDDANECYAYTGAHETSTTEGMSDARHFERTKTALGLIGVSETQQECLFEVLAGIVHLGQLKIRSKNGNEESEIVPNDSGAKNATQLLGISTTDLEKALCSRQIAVAGDTVTAFLKKDQAEECAGALSKAIYSNVFDWLVETINTSLENDTKMRYHVGILDIFGFEHFKHNSFEQFCINYANEKLQQKFTQDVFKTVQLEYEAEGIVWSHIDFADNQDVISVIEDRLGIISLLNDEVMRPKGNDESLVSKLSTIHKDEQDVIEFPRTSRTQFTINHYAGAVTLRFLRKLRAIVKLQSVARCVIMMNRYQSFKAAVITLQAQWRGYKGRHIALKAKKNRSAITIQKYARRFVKREQFKGERKGAVKIQAFLRMKYERPKYLKALQEKKQQDDMEHQLNKLQERLHDEQRRNADLKKDGMSLSSSESPLYANTNDARSRGQSTAHMWMADADGIISQLNEKAGRLRKENEEQRASNVQLKREIEKLKFDQTVLTANFQVKMRGFRDTIREKDKKLEAVERECVKFREMIGSDPALSSRKSIQKDRRSVFRKLGSKKESDDIGDENSDTNRPSTVMQATLTQKSAETAQFLRQSARRITSWRKNSGDDSDGENRHSGSDMTDMGGRASLLQEVGAAGAGAMESLKSRLTAVKDKYYGEEELSARSRASDRLSSASESCNLDALPLPPGWKARLSRSKGNVYYCNPTLSITQWDHPSIDASRAKKQGAAAAQRAKRGSTLLRGSAGGLPTMEGHI
ncbi:unnamed protein product [Hyaloperonospora brassicae]|uniref:Myosin motor domain-containing protein n=1 Tax=Hyaloperonospora brassicae TaxID=162125 RepID=A0AAV0U726_HYABA|nr:unnamed protein product [Hyaloperonospora brassicae]